MQDISRYPTIRSLAASLADAAPRPAPLPAVEAATPSSMWEYILCGALQALFLLAYSYVAVVAITEGYNWVSAGKSAIGIYLRIIKASSFAFLVVCDVPIVGKCSLVVHLDAQPNRLMTPGYVRVLIVTNSV